MWKGEKEGGWRNMVKEPQFYVNKYVGIKNNKCFEYINDQKGANGQLGLPLFPHILHVTNIWSPLNLPVK